MGKISGLEDPRKLPPKVCRLYAAVIGMLEEGMDPAALRVSMITERAGIGKGTAYEYFDSKEEIVAGAIVYQIRCMSDWLEGSLGKLGSFREKVLFLMEEIESRNGHKACFLRFIHMMTDHSECSRMARERMEAEAFRPYRPMNVFRRILAGGVAAGELSAGLPLDYMAYCLFSKLMAYMMAVAEGSPEVSREEMRALVCRGILEELGAKRNSFLEIN